MAGHTDLPFRLLCRSIGGVGLASTDLLNVHSLLRGSPKALALAATAPGDEPLCMQLYGNEHDPLPDAARWAVNNGADVIDINMGCPVDKVAKKHGGSLLLCDVDSTVRLAERIVEAITPSTGKPVTAKIRLGWDDDRIVGPPLARALEQVGIAAVTVHGRTTEQFFKGRACLQGIKAVVDAVDAIPVIGNGDIEVAADAQHMMDVTGCDGVMIARGALRRPWVFHQIHGVLTEGVAVPEPTFKTKVEYLLRHLELIMEHLDERNALHRMRSGIAKFARTMGHVKPLKEGIRTANSSAEIERVLRFWHAKACDGWTPNPILEGKAADARTRDLTTA
ncbi:MAG: tRNA-dihydrouridine synthase [Phycisphaerales bacterium]|nr:tRNA-dihydrouridine synthase [Phycisphaerales bacterium]